MSQTCFEHTSACAFCQLREDGPCRTVLLKFNDNCTSLHHLSSGSSLTMDKTRPLSTQGTHLGFHLCQTRDSVVPWARHVSRQEVKVTEHVWNRRWVLILLSKGLILNRSYSTSLNVHISHCRRPEYCYHNSSWPSLVSGQPGDNTLKLLCWKRGNKNEVQRFVRK